jgi:hypothetical protein
MGKATSFRKIIREYYHGRTAWVNEIVGWQLGRKGGGFRKGLQLAAAWIIKDLSEGKRRFFRGEAQVT